MTRLLCNLWPLQPSSRWLVALATVALVGSPLLMAAEVAELDFDPSDVPTVKWMPKEHPVPDASAATEAEMKPYTEEIPGTGLKFDMVPIPGGTFLMGSPEDEEGRQDDEGPQEIGRAHV